VLKIKDEIQTPVATVEIFEELTLDEERERHRLELKVERAFFEAGLALRELREQRLYRSTHRTFEEYCSARFGYTRRRPYQLIEAAIVFENLCTIGTQDDVPLVERRVLPTNERQVRDLVNLEPEQQRQVWQQAVEQAEGKVPTGRLVKSVVEEIKHKSIHLASDYCFEGEVFFLQRLIGNEKKYNGCWAIAIEVENRFTVKAAVYNGALDVTQENMKPIDSQQTQAEVRNIYERITRLQQIASLEQEAKYVLEGMAKQSSLTEVGEKILTCLEEHYKIGQNLSHSPSLL
jgi:hypothetical protein